MLYGIDRTLSAELVYLLMQMGHGDEIVISDANFPSASTVIETVSGTLVDLPHLDAPTLMAAIARHFPLDEFVPECAWRMEIDNAPNELGDVHTATFEVLNAAKPKATRLGSIERQEFYKRAKKCFAVVRTGEMRPYGCFILRKGVIF